MSTGGDFGGLKFSKSHRACLSRAKTGSVMMKIGYDKKGDLRVLLCEPKKAISYHFTFPVPTHPALSLSSSTENVQEIRANQGKKCRTIDRQSRNDLLYARF
jgi:hypothetical protein